MLHQAGFRALGTDVRIWLWSEHPQARTVLDSLPALFEEAEDEFSRFRPDSALSRLNTKAGRGPQRVSGLLSELCRLALEAAQETGGIFDPTILPALQACGYGVSFGDLRADGGATSARHDLAPRWQEVRVESERVSLPAGAALDLGGIAKGWIVDRVATLLCPLGAAMVDAGGDIRANGPLAKIPWPVSVADPFMPQRTLAQAALADEALVTSSVGRRRWQQAGVWRHHLIDPRTQLPGASDAHTVSVLGPTARRSEVHAKVALLQGMEAGALHLEAQGLSGILIDHAGAVRWVGDRLTPPEP